MHAAGREDFHHEGVRAGRGDFSRFGAKQVDFAGGEARRAEFLLEAPHAGVVYGAVWEVAGDEVRGSGPGVPAGGAGGGDGEAAAGVAGAPVQAAVLAVQPGFGGGAVQFRGLRAAGFRVAVYAGNVGEVVGSGG